MLTARIWRESSRASAPRDSLVMGSTAKVGRWVSCGRLTIYLAILPEGACGRRAGLRTRRITTVVLPSDARILPSQLEIVLFIILQRNLSFIFHFI